MKYQTKLIGVAIALGLVLLPSAALAFSAKSGDAITVPGNTTHEGTLYAGGSSITIDGNIDGDLVCAAQTVIVNGDIAGDVLCAAQTITLNGAVEGDVRAATADMTVNGHIGHNLNNMGSILSIGSKALVEEEVAFLGATLNQNGEVRKDLYGSMDTINISGRVGRNLNIWPLKVNFGPAGAVGGNLTYTSDGALSINSSKVSGKITHHELVIKKPSAQDRVINALLSLIMGFASTLLISFMLIWLLPKFVKRFSDIQLKKAGLSVGVGALVLFMGPVAAIAAMCTGIGLPLGFLILSLWAMLFLISTSAAAIAAGQFILGKLKLKGKSPYLGAGLGGLLVAIVISLPWVGVFIGIFVALWGTGGLFLTLKSQR